MLKYVSASRRLILHGLVFKGLLMLKFEKQMIDINLYCSVIEIIKKKCSTFSRKKNTSIRILKYP